MTLRLIPQTEFARVRAAVVPWKQQLAAIATMCRLNTLVAVKRAGSGHLGSSFSAMDIVVWLYYRKLNTLAVGLRDPNRDVYFSSKGHDVPGLYSVLYALGVLPQDQLLKLRRLSGPHGHPDISTPGIEANSGSLGMGISKGRGMAWAKRKLGLGGRVFVMTGDGEFQEGQNYEAMQGATQLKQGGLTVILDHNKVQSDLPVTAIVNLGNLEQKFAAFGWQVARCDGHSVVALERSLAELDQAADRPKLLIADTIKGRGVSFMEHPTALKATGTYPWHAGAPNDEKFAAAFAELLEAANRQLAALGMPPLQLATVPEETGNQAAPKAMLVGEQLSQEEIAKLAQVSDEYVVNAFGEALAELGNTRDDLVVLDADLAADCRLRAFAQRFPDRFLEIGIAEQDMVAVAGGLARQGLLPVVNSFGSFLASRANEQIYTNAGERSKIIYVCHYAGLIPAGPGKSHQCLRDISLLGAIPGITILQPCNAAETKQALAYCVNTATGTCVLRLNIGPSPRTIPLPDGYRLEAGRGVTLRAGNDAVIFTYGPVMLHEALLASELLAQRQVGLQVVNLPWLNRLDLPWCRATLGDIRRCFVLEDHHPLGGLADFLLPELHAYGLLADGRTLTKFGVVGWPACGRPPEVLRFHGLDGATLAERIAAALR